MWREVMRDALRRDVRHALRQLRRAPGFTVVAVATLALGIGATTAIFSAVHAVVLRPLPFREPDRLVRIYATSPSTTQSDEVSPRTFAVWRRDQRSFDRLAAVERRSVTYADGARVPQQALALRTTADYFPMLGVAPQIGRAFTADEDRPGRDRVAVLSHRFWVSRLGADRGVIGRTVRVDALPFVVVGVMPATFDVTAGQVDVWTPIAFTAEQETADETGYLEVVARLRPHVSIAQAQADLAAATRRAATGQERGEQGVRVASYEDELTGGLRPRLFTLLGAVGLVLLIACANVASLLFARGAGRAREFAVRAAMGAAHSRLVRQLLTESLVLSAMGGALGLVLAQGGLRALKAVGPTDVPRLEQATVDAWVLGFALLLVVATAVLSGLVPALRAAKPQLQRDLKEGGRAPSAATRARVRNALVSVEVALSIVLLVGAGLLIRSAILLQRVDPGLRPTNVWTGAITLPSTEYREAGRIVQTFERVLDGVRATPGVQSAALVSVSPFTGLSALSVFVPEGRVVEPSNYLMANFRLVSPGLFRTLGIPVLTGRDFSADDRAGTTPVVVVNEAFARLAWPGERVVGRKLLGPGGDSGRRVYREVVGVVGATKEDGLREASRPAVYYAIRQVPTSLWASGQNSSFLVARTAVDPLSITQSVQQVVSGVDRGVPVYAVRSMEQRIAEMSAAARFNTQLLTALGGVGLLLAVVGIYGVVAYFVSGRTQEIGVRMALGASPHRVVALVVWQALRPTLVGLGVGCLAAIGAARVLASQLYGVGPGDPLTFAVVSALLLAASALAAAVPARAAAAIDPREALHAG
jgi:putative ABC transport system permease protein